MNLAPVIRNVLTFTAVAGLISGCATDNYHESSETAVTLKESAHMVTRCNMLIDQSLADLSDLISNPHKDLRAPFHRYGKDVDELEAAAADLAHKDHEMRSEGADYFAQWDKELAKINNEDIRSRSQARKNEVASRFTSISQQYDQANQTFRPFLSDLRDVKTALSTDLTMGGLDSIKGTAAKANQDAMPVKDSLAKLSDQFRSLGMSMSPIEQTSQPSQ